MNRKPYVIAEMSANHAGSLEVAKGIVRAAASCGADCLKTQLYTADSLTLPYDFGDFVVGDGTWKDKRLYDLYSLGAMPSEWHFTLRDLCHNLGMDYLVTVYDWRDIPLAETLGITTYKVASFELTDTHLLSQLAQTGAHIIMSCGMANMSEIGRAVRTLTDAGYSDDQFSLLHCISSYPADEGEMNLSTIPVLRNEFHCKVGLSDHSEGNLSSVMAVALGADIIERHICLSHDIETSDSSFSLDPTQFSEFVGCVRRAHQAMGVPFALSDNQLFYRKYRRSLYVVEDIQAGDTFTCDNVRSVRPASGLDPHLFDSVIGKRASRSIRKGQPLTWEAIDGNVSQ